MPRILLPLLLQLMATVGVLPAQRATWTPTHSSGLPSGFVGDGAFDSVHDAPVLIGTRPPTAGAAFRLMDGTWIPACQPPRGTLTAALAWNGESVVAVTVDDSEPAGFRFWVLRDDGLESQGPRTVTGFRPQAVRLVHNAASGHLVLHACRTDEPITTQPGSSMGANGSS